jgi:AcrR family transcriptional regulator
MNEPHLQPHLEPHLQPLAELTLRQRRSDKRKTEILEAALWVLSEDGYNHASMDKIAEKALLTRAGLYKHFKDKSTLVVALREYKLLELAQKVRDVLQNHHSFEAQLCAVVTETVQYQNQNQGFFRVLLASSFSSDLNVDYSLKPFLYAVAGVFELGLRQNLIHPADPLEYAGLLATLVFEPSIKQAFIPHTLLHMPPATQPETISGIFLRGVLLRGEI